MEDILKEVIPKENIPTEISHVADLVGGPRHLSAGGGADWVYSHLTSTTSIDNKQYGFLGNMRQPSESSQANPSFVLS
jgi:hypothetical protein